MTTRNWFRLGGALLVATVLAQLAVPRASVRWRIGRLLVAGLLLLGIPAPLYLLPPFEPVF